MSCLTNLLLGCSLLFAAGCDTNNYAQMNWNMALDLRDECYRRGGQPVWVYKGYMTILVGVDCQSPRREPK